ncbi:uncharacterized protein LOC113930700 [Zalophus californianus]|uniref:Uncharacterized protein LOC113930700 n=1 Tax=Zalophus californianus TaxID=9704 RepID=A0A6J2EDX1_ZALCA|nr:uncharacterized protein LOC113930700 [Zalophus californianus]
MWLIPGSYHSLTTSSLPISPSTMVHSWEIPSSHTILSLFVPIHLAPSWKIPSPHKIQLSYLPLPHPSGSFLENTIPTHHPLCLIPGTYHPAFLSPPSTVAHSWKISFPHTINLSCLPPWIKLTHGRYHPTKHPSLSPPVHRVPYLEDTIPSHISFLLSPPHQLGHSWKVPSPHTIQPFYLLAYTVAHSWTIPSAYTIQLSFLHPSTVAHSLKIPFSHTAHPFCLSPSAMAHSWNMSSPYYPSICSPPNHCGTFLVDFIFPHHSPFLSVPKYYGSFLEDTSFHTIHLSSLSPSSTLWHSWKIPCPPHHPPFPISFHPL